MREIWGSVTKGMSVILLIVLLSPIALAQAGRGDLFMTGFVRNEDGSPRDGAKVVAVYVGGKYSALTSPIPPSSYPPRFFEDRSAIKRESITDEKGKWTLLFLKKGKWIVSAFSKERMSEMTDVLLNANRRNIELTLTKTAAGFLSAAKSAIYEEDYEKAIQILSWFISYFPESRELESALFWISHTHDRLSRSKEDRREAIRLKTKAFPYLDRLTSDFPESEWADDAEILRIDIALRLYQMGHKEHIEVIEKGLSIKDRSKIDIKLAALTALLRMDQKRAIGHLSDLALNDPDPGVRKKAVLILGQSGAKEALILLEKIAEKDPESSVRKAATIWLERH
ncbi:MAG: HEAT repeat domain-containing protein [Candidatus Aminicenantes bacterium]|nr:MAG: HEAT repeat domain-containing protein [Candidatus Aminicenantes bacterium]